MAKKTTNVLKKVTPIAETKAEDSLFVVLSEPVILRRHLLQCSKEFLIILKKIETIKTIRLEKLECMEILKVLIKDLKTLMLKLKKSLPLESISSSSDLVKHSLAKNKVSNNNSNAVEKLSKTEIEKLNDELYLIETKLGGL